MEDAKITSKREKEKEVVSLMIRLYCKKQHGTKTELCPECAELEQYARSRSDRCPFMEEKTFCSNCRVHCYKPEMREKIRAVMRFSGPRMIFHHPVMAASHVIESKREQRRQNKDVVPMENLTEQTEQTPAQTEAKSRFRIFWIVLGFLCLALGTIGVVLPILPTVPFFLATLFCFTKSSEKLHHWFIGTSLYKKHLESYVKKEGMLLKTKLSIVTMVTLLMGVGFFLMARKDIWVPCIILAVVWVAHVIYFFGFVKTIPAPERKD